MKETLKNVKKKLHIKTNLSCHNGKISVDSDTGKAYCTRVFLSSGPQIRLCPQYEGSVFCWEWQDSHINRAGGSRDGYANTHHANSPTRGVSHGLTWVWFLHRLSSYLSKGLPAPNSQASVPSAQCLGEGPLRELKVVDLIWDYWFYLYLVKFITLKIISMYSLCKVMVSQ